MSIYRNLKKSISSFSEEDYNLKIIEKCNQKEYSEWNSFVANMDIGLNIISDTTSQNASYTCCANLSKVLGDINLRDNLVIQKSIFTNYFTMYINSRLLVKHEGTSIDFPTTLIVSNIGYYADLFLNVWSKITANYPTAEYLMYRHYSMSLETKFETNKNAYELLFGYEGNVTNYPFVGNKNYVPKLAK